MSNCLIAYGATLTGVFTLTTISLVEDHPVVLAASFPVAALAFVVLMLGVREWRPRRGRS